VTTPVLGVSARRLRRVAAETPNTFGIADVHYPDGGGAVAALVLASDPAFAHVTGEFTAELTEVEPYRPGEFALRELPAIAAVLAVAPPVGLLIVDGYVDLDPDGRPGLGAHAHDAFGIPVVGVAKTAFRPAAHAIPVLRGGSAKPLFVTAAGLPVAGAAAMVSAMAGRYRVPDAVKRVDRLCRNPGVVR
jgi:deoxyribonuclease V